MASNKQTESCLYGDSKSGYSPALIFPLSAIDRAKSDRAARRKLLLGSIHMVIRRDAYIHIDIIGSAAAAVRQARTTSCRRIVRDP